MYESIRTISFDKQPRRIKQPSALTTLTFANLTPIDKSTLIDKCQLLDAIAGDDDIEWQTNPFEIRPDSASLE